MTKNKKLKTITAEDLYRFELPGQPRISPNGDHVIYALTRVDKNDESKYSNLWLASTKSGRPRQFTFGDQSDRSPEWSPDGNQIAFFSNRTDAKSSQIHIIPLDGGEARPLTNITGSIAWFKWAPDGKNILCAIQKMDKEDLDREKDERKKALGRVQRHITRVFFKFDGSGFHSIERTHLWVVNARTGRARQLTDHAVYDEADASWSADGKMIAFVSNRTDEPDLQPDENYLYQIAIHGGKAKKIQGPNGSKYLPAYSPDGKWIAYYGTEGSKNWWKNTCLWIIKSNGRQDPINLTEEFDLNIAASTLNDVGGLELRPPTWSAEGDRLYFTVDYHGSTILKSVNIEGEDLQAHTEGPCSVGSVSFSDDRKSITYIKASMDSPGNVYYQDLETNEVRKLSRLNRWLESIELGSVEEVWFKGSNGNELQGWILTPPGFDPKKKYPSIMEIHGGPLAQYGNHFMHEFYYLAAQGYVVYFSNPRGGQGYGEEHARAIWGKWGTVDYEDLMCWADFVSKKRYIDKKRMGVTGGSYGGFMTLWIIGHTQRFKSAVAQRVLSNFVSMWGTSDLNWTFQEVINDLPPYKDLNNAWDRSPLKYIGEAKTPTLIIHSESDHRTPIEQGEQAYVALKTLGVDTEFVRFPGEPHGLSRVGRTDRRIARLEHISRWFKKYLN